MGAGDWVGAGGVLLGTSGRVMGMPGAAWHNPRGCRGHGGHPTESLKPTAILTNPPNHLLTVTVRGRGGKEMSILAGSLLITAVNRHWSALEGLHARCYGTLMPQLELAFLSTGLRFGLIQTVSF